MGLTKQYLRYAALGSWGVVASPTANLVYLRGNLVVVPALEKVVVWDIRKNEKVNEFSEGTDTVTSLAVYEGANVAAGYADGTIRIFKISSTYSDVVFSGHSSAVTVLKFDGSGSKLCSGSLDTNVVVWDVVAQCGLYRLKGHKGPITDVLFLVHSNVLITSSKDTFIKLWDLDTQHAFETLTNGRDEVWSLAVCSNETRLIGGSNKPELRVWSLKSSDSEPGKRKSTETKIDCELLGAITRKSKDRVSSLIAIGPTLFCQNNDATVELYKIRSDTEKEKVIKRKRKKLKSESDVSLSVEEEFPFSKVLKCGHKIRSFSGIELANKNVIKFCCLHNNNKIQSFDLSRDLELTPKSSVESLGHRNDVRTVLFTSDSSRVVSVSDGAAKLWSCKTKHCITTVECGSVLCGVIAPGDQYIVVGTKKGEVQLLDVVSGSLVESLTSHEGPIWGMALRSDNKGFITGSADKTVKFWEFTLVSANQGANQRLGIDHVKTLQMTEDVVAVCYSKNNKFLAVGQLDCTVKVFFTDTLKFYISLYGHKLPVTTIDISHDNTLIVTGSADKNIKIWGLDFGDCHRSLFAHDEAVMSVKFIPDTHMFFSVGRDKKLKQWDADKFEHIQTLEGHHKEVWSVDVSSSGEFVVTSSHDKSIRLWERTDEPIVLEDERETARELEYEKSLVATSTTIAGERDSGEAEHAGKKNMENIKAAERIMEAIEILREERAKDTQYQEELEQSKDKGVAPPERHVILATLNMTGSDYVLDVLRKVRPSEIELSLLVLPFHYVIDLLGLLDTWLKERQHVELCCKCALYLLRVYHNQIVANKVLVAVIESLNRNTVQAIDEIRDTIGFNLAGLKFLQMDYEEGTETFFSDHTDKITSIRKKKRAVLKTVS